MAQTEDYIQEAKQKALYQAYKQALKKLLQQNVSPGRLHSLAVIEAINTPQKRFWLSHDRVYRILRAALKGGEQPGTWNTRTELYTDILKTYDRVKNLRMFKGKPLSFIASYVTYEPSRGFYMSASRAQRMIKEEKDRLRKQRMEAHEKD